MSSKEPRPLPPLGEAKVVATSYHIDPDTLDITEVEPKPTAERLQKRIDELEQLTASLRKQLVLLAENLSERSNSLGLELRKTRELTADNDRLKQRMSELVPGIALQSMATQLAESKIDNARLQTELSELRRLVNRHDHDYLAVHKELDKAHAENGSLREAIQIENEINQGCTQAEIANTYAMALVSSWPTDWKRVNEAIVAKWPKGLNRVKTWAWKIVNSKGQWQPGKKPTP